MSDKYDAVIIGSGPAGSSAAIRLALDGRRVLLAEKSQFPRHKLCGEFISPECLNHFEELGAKAVTESRRAPQIHKTVFYSHSGRSLSISNSWLDGKNSYSIGLSRAAMDDLLLHRAKDLGVEIRTSTSFVGPIVENGKVAGVNLRAKCETTSYPVTTMLAVDATGRGRSLARCRSR